MIVENFGGKSAGTYAMRQPASNNLPAFSQTEFQHSERLRRHKSVPRSALGLHTVNSELVIGRIDPADPYITQKTTLQIDNYRAGDQVVGCTLLVELASNPSF